MGMVAQELAQGAAEDAHAGAVDDADAGQAGEEGAVEEALDFVLGFVGGAADDVDLGGHVVGVVGGGATVMPPRLRAASSGVTTLTASTSAMSSMADAHLHGADGDFEVLGVDDALDAGLAAEALELDEVADLDAFGDVGLGGGIVLVGAGGVGDDGGVELLGELAASRGRCGWRSRARSSARRPCRRWL